MAVAGWGAAFLGAIRFLTAIPSTNRGAVPGRAALFFPLIGAILGTLGAALYFALVRWVPATLASFGLLAFWTLSTGTRHERALAAIADLFATRRRHIGAVGVLVVLLSVSVRWRALTTFALLPHSLFLAALIASQAVPRTAIVALAWTSRPAEPLPEVYSTLSMPVAIAAILQGAVTAFACGLRAGVILAAGTYLILRFARWLVYSRIGGATRDSIAAVNQIVEMFVLLLFACPACVR